MLKDKSVAMRIFTICKKDPQCLYNMELNLQSTIKCQHRHKTSSTDRLYQNLELCHIRYKEKPLSACYHLHYTDVEMCPLRL